MENEKKYAGLETLRSFKENADSLYATKTEVNVAMQGLGSAAYTNSSAYDAAGTAQTKADSALSSAKSYTDTKISNLINGAPTTLDTLGEIATAMEENADVVDALEAAIGTKANASHNHDASNITSGTISVDRLPSSTTSAKGIVQLTNSTSSTSTTTAATPNSVKSAYDLANQAKTAAATAQTTADGKLSLSGGTMTGAITYSTVTGQNKSSNYISAGGGFSANSGKYGVKLLCCDQPDCQTGLGQDLTGLNGGYELTVAGGRSSGGIGYISFAMHDVDSKDYTRLGYFDSSGNFHASGSIYSNGSNIQTQLDGKVSKNDNNRAYNDLVSYYSPTVPTYYRITFPDSVATTWTMINMEITIRETYSVETGGKIFINAHHSNTTTVWTINASTLGNLTSGIKVYSSDGKYFYIKGCSGWSTISIDKVLVGDAATGLDISDIKIDIVSELPTTYQTATMYYGIHSGNIGSQSVNYATSAGSVSTTDVLRISAGSTAYINSGANTSLIFQKGGTGHARFDTSGHFVPETDSTYNIGSSEKAWKNVYADNFVGALTGNATSATSSTKATQDGSGNTITSTYATKTELDTAKSNLQTSIAGKASKSDIPDYITTGAKSGTTIGKYATAEGFETTATGDYSHAEGYRTTVISANSAPNCAYASHAEGGLTTASGAYAHAEGVGTTASGMDSHAEGHYTTAGGDYSHAAGYYTTANNYQYVVGKYNADTTAPTGVSDTTTSAGLFIVGIGTGSSARKNGFRVNPAGKCYSQSTFGTSGADYAEYFEWLDGNPNNEDRRGHFVALEGGKIRYANPNDDYILGVVSADPSVAGDIHSENWHNMHLKDVFGSPIIEVVEVEETTNEDGEVIPAHTERRLVLNPDYNPDVKYISREERPEWAAIGIVGKLVVVDDGTCQVNGYCYPNTDGIATSSQEKTNYRVMERLDDTHIRIFIK